MFKMPCGLKSISQTKMLKIKSPKSDYLAMLNINKNLVQSDANTLKRAQNLS